MYRVMHQRILEMKGPPIDVRLGIMSIIFKPLISPPPQKDRLFTRPNHLNQTTSKRNITDL